MNALGLQPVVHRIPAFITPFPGGHTVGRAATFRFEPANPWWTRITVADTELIVSRNGLHQGLVGDHLEPSGLVSVYPRASNGTNWVHIEIDKPDRPTATVGVRAERLAAFIGDTFMAVPPGYEDDFQDLLDDEAFDEWLSSLAGAA